MNPHRNPLLNLKMLLQLFIELLFQIITKLSKNGR